MIECDAMQDRMPAVARGESVWTDGEAAHLASCAECSHEWRLVQGGVSLHAGAAIDADQIADHVLARLRAEPAVVPAIRRIPWRGGMIGLLAAAASVALVIWAPRRAPIGSGASSDTAQLAIAPELQGLDDRQLETVLKGLQPIPVEVAAPNDGLHLEDLTDAQLQQLLHSMGGE